MQMDLGVCAQRRQRLMERMGDGVAVLSNASVSYRNRDVAFPFRSNSDFLYLTGFNEPDAVAVLLPGHPKHPFVLFVPPKDPDKEVWTGVRAGIESAQRDFGAHCAYTLDELDEIIPQLLANRERLFTHIGRDPAFDSRMIGWLNRTRARERAGVRAPSTLVDLQEVIQEMRLIKAPEELDHMREAARISAEAHRRIQEACYPGIHEYQLQAELEHTFRYEGAEGPSYPPIVAGGANACVLHYTENRSPLRDGELVLVDAGCEVAGYAADITRTFPVGKSATGAQRAVWEIVYEAQQVAIDAVREGNTFDAYHQAAVRVLTRGMVELGLLTGRIDSLIEEEQYKRFFMHRTGHWLGLDVHDVGRYQVAPGQWRTLKPNMVLTVEPGLYIPTETEDVPSELRGIGVRIEDDVRVTEGEPEVLTAAAPKGL